MIPLTKIIATLGPATSSEKQISALMKAGASIFRLNFSHGSYDEHLKRIQIIRSLAKKNKTHYTILADMQGPKLRVGHFKDGEIILRAGEQFILDTNENTGNEKRVHLPHPEIFKVIKPKMNLLLNDGKIVLNVVKVTKNQIQTKVIVGGILSDHKGLNVPDVVLPISSLTTKDKKDLAFAIKAGVDWICLSFVQKADDIRSAGRADDLVDDDMYNVTRSLYVTAGLGIPVFYHVRHTEHQLALHLAYVVGLFLYLVIEPLVI